jgi:3-hydroxyisobutyrate dehydrogenase
VQRIAAECDHVLLSLPDGKAVVKAVEAVVGQLEPHLRAGHYVAGIGRCSVELTRRIGDRLAGKGIRYADAPVARTREAAARGELGIIVGATAETFGAHPAHPGDDGERRDALRARRVRPGGEDPEQHGGVPALLNHGMRAMLPGVFPERAFSTRYAMKDPGYALELAEACGLDMKAAKLTMERLKHAEAAGFGDLDHPVVLKVIDPEWMVVVLIPFR